jgi:hypothetical protein
MDWQGSSLPWPPKIPDLTLLDFLLGGGLLKELRLHGKNSEPGLFERKNPVSR